MNKHNDVAPAVAWQRDHKWLLGRLFQPLTRSTQRRGEMSATRT